MKENVVFNAARFHFSQVQRAIAEIKALNATEEGSLMVKKFLQCSDFLFPFSSSSSSLFFFFFQRI